MLSVTLFPLRPVLMVLLRRTGELIIEHSMTFLRSLKIEAVPFPMKLERKWLKFIMNKCGIYFQAMLPRKNILLNYAVYLFTPICKSVLLIYYFISTKDCYSNVVVYLLFFLNSHTLGILTHSQPFGLAVPDATMLPVNATSDVIELMDIGLKNRAVGATAMNERSSRSHRFVCLFYYTLKFSSPYSSFLIFHVNLQYCDYSRSWDGFEGWFLTAW